MAKLKKLAILCLALFGTVAIATGCETTNNSSSTDSSSVQVTTYTVTVNAPSNVAIDGDLTAEAGKDVTFTATAVKGLDLTATGAELVGEKAESTDKLSYVYTYKVAALSADTTVEITTADTPAVLYEKVESEALAPLTLVPNADPIEVTLPLEQGNYYIELVSELAGDVKAGPASYWMEAITYQVLTEDMYDNGYTFYIAYEEANSTAESVSVEYNVYKVLETGVTKTEGSATILSGVDTSLFFFTFPEAGVYKISTSEEVTFGEYLSEALYEERVDHPNTDYLLIETSTSYQSVEIIVNKVGVDTFTTFDWSVEKVESTAMTLGSNTVEQAIGDWVEYTFTATEEGAYTLALTGDDAAYFSVAQADSMYDVTSNEAVEFDVYENETVSVWVRYNGGKYIPDTAGEEYATLAGTVSLTKTGAVGDRFLPVYAKVGFNPIWNQVMIEVPSFDIVAGGSRNVIISINDPGVIVSWYDNITVKCGDDVLTSGEAYMWNEDGSSYELTLTVINNSTEEAASWVGLNVEGYTPAAPAKVVELDTATDFSIDRMNSETTESFTLNVESGTDVTITFSNYQGEYEIQSLNPMTGMFSPVAMEIINATTTSITFTYWGTELKISTVWGCETYPASPALSFTITVTAITSI